MQMKRIFAPAAALVVLAASGVVAFATIAPDPREAEMLLTRTATVEPLPIGAEQVLPGPAAYIREERFQSGDTLAGFLGRLGVAPEQSVRLLKLRGLHQVHPGSTVRAEVEVDGTPKSISFLIGRDKLLQVLPDGDGSYKAAEYPAPLEPAVAMKSGVIRTSLFAATDAAGIPDAIGMQLADIFGGDVDFYHGLRRGDRFSVVYEEQRLAGMPVRSGRVLAAEFVNDGRTYRAVYYAKSYYTPEGKSLRKTFLRSPLQFSRVSSGFGLRMHPIIKGWRKHEGIDFAAPMGTPVRAAGDGVVEFVGKKGGYGNVIIVRHPNQYSTTYGHLSRFATGLRRGARLAQGETIGFVGMTGLATGPHLHYEFRIAGQARNPFSIALPSALPVPAQELEAFGEQAAPLISRLDLLTTTNLALLD